MEQELGNVSERKPGVYLLPEINMALIPALSTAAPHYERTPD